MQKNALNYVFILGIFSFTIACNSDDSLSDLDPCTGISCPTGQECMNGTCVDNSLGDGDECTKGIELNTERGACNETLSETPYVNITETATERIIETNSIPDHNVGLFGGGQGSLNPNAIQAQDNTYSISKEPQKASSLTNLSDNGPKYSFGVLLNGLELDPVAAEPWPHDRMNMTNVNWDWNLEAINVLLGLDCNNAHVQPSGKYHHHASPTLYLESIGINSNEMTLIGYAADGFPIYHKYGYSNPDDMSSSVMALSSSYQLKTGGRPGDGNSAPCGEYNGIYTNDYEYIPGLGDLDECNGREGVTPEFPEGIYYYVVTDEFPAIPRCFVGTPSNDFRIGG